MAKEIKDGHQRLLSQADMFDTACLHFCRICTDAICNGFPLIWHTPLRQGQR